MNCNETNSPESFTLIHANITEADAKNLEPAKIVKNKNSMRANWGDHEERNCSFLLAVKNV